jgi:hypothetical protein
MSDGRPNWRRALALEACDLFKKKRTTGATDHDMGCLDAFEW